MRLANHRRRIRRAAHGIRRSYCGQPGRSELVSSANGFLRFRRTTVGPNGPGNSEIRTLSAVAKECVNQCPARWACGLRPFRPWKRWPRNSSPRYLSSVHFTRPVASRSVPERNQGQSRCTLRPDPHSGRTLGELTRTPAPLGCGAWRRDHGQNRQKAEGPVG